MAELNQVIGAILRDITEARVISDAYSRTVSETYEQDSLLRHFPVPRAEIDDIEIELRFVVTNVEEDIGRRNLRIASLDGIFEKYSGAIARGSARELESRFPPPTVAHPGEEPVGPERPGPEPTRPAEPGPEPGRPRQPGPPPQEPERPEQPRGSGFDMIQRQAQYVALMQRYQAEMTQYVAVRARWDAAQRDYEARMREWSILHRRWQEEMNRYRQQLARYEQEKAAWDEAIAEYTAEAMAFRDVIGRYQMELRQYQEDQRITERGRALVSNMGFIEQVQRAILGVFENARVMLGTSALPPAQPDGEDESDDTMTAVEEEAFIINQIINQLDDVLDKHLLQYPPIRDALRRDEVRQQAREAVLSLASDQVVQLVNEATVTLQSLPQEYMVDVDMTSETLQEAPASAISSIRLKTSIRNYVWTHVEDQGLDAVRRLIPE